MVVSHICNIVIVWIMTVVDTVNSAIISAILRNTRVERKK
jgi:hypothetical protein